MFERCKPIAVLPTKVKPEDTFAHEQAKLEQELLPLSTVLVEIEKKIASGDCIPDFGTLTAWAAGEAEKLGSPAARRAGRRPNTAEISIKMEGKFALAYLRAL